MTDQSEIEFQYTGLEPYVKTPFLSNKFNRQPQKIYSKKTNKLSIFDADIGLFEPTLIKPGLILLMSDLFTENPISVCFNVNEAHLRITYNITGENCFTIHSRYFSTKRFVSPPETNTILFFPDCRGTYQINSQQLYQSITILIDPSLMREYVDNDIESMPLEIRKIISHCDSNFYIKKTPTTFQEATIVHQIMSCPFDGSVKKLFLESKVIELLSTFILKQMDQKSIGVENSVLKGAGDIDRLFHARDIILNDISNAPTISELSRLSYLNEFKLKKGFKAFFGKTIHSYLQNERMNKAKLLIEGGGLNVSEIAGEIGYTNVSHFIAAYRKAYGVNPGSLLKEIQNRAQ